MAKVKIKTPLGVVQADEKDLAALEETLRKEFPNHPEKQSTLLERLTNQMRGLLRKTESDSAAQLANQIWLLKGLSKELTGLSEKTDKNIENTAKQNKLTLQSLQRHIENASRADREALNKSLGDVAIAIKNLAIQNEKSIKQVSESVKGITLEAPTVEVQPPVMPAAPAVKEVEVTNIQYSGNSVNDRAISAKVTVTEREKVH